MKSEILQIIIEMLAGDFEDDGTREAMLTHELRIIDDEPRFIKICHAIAVSGSWYCVPTLMALSQPENSTEQLIAINHVLEGVRRRIPRDPASTER